VNLETLATVSLIIKPWPNRLASRRNLKTWVHCYLQVRLATALVRALFEQQNKIFTIFSHALILFDFQFFPFSDRGATGQVYVTSLSRAHYILVARLSPLPPLVVGNEQGRQRTESLATTLIKLGNDFWATGSSRSCQSYTVFTHYTTQGVWSEN